MHPAIRCCRQIRASISSEDVPWTQHCRFRTAQTTATTCAADPHGALCAEDLHIDLRIRLGTGGAYIGEALNAVQYAQVVHARNIAITGHCGSALLTDGSLAREIPIIARLRAQELARTLKKLGLPRNSTLTVRWDDALEPANGVNDPDRRRAEIAVTP